MKEFNRLLAIMKRLRHPQRGCPWDVEQTEKSLQEFVLEEAYELVDAVDSKSAKKIKEELGDLLLQVVFLSRLAEEKGQFSINDVIKGLNEKLINRHPHVFAGLKLHSASQVRNNWDKLKMKEKKRSSVLSRLPAGMPALLAAHRLATQASAIGFDWQDANLAFVKVQEEIGELQAEMKRKRRQSSEEEIGDLLFSICNVARLLRINPECALRRSNKKFRRRFRFVERETRRKAGSGAQVTLAEMDRFWDISKKRKK